MPQADIQQKLKIALDETRMLIMGVQILIGFQFQAIVQEGFASLSSASKACIGAALILMVWTTGLLIAPAAQHRLAENGEASARTITITTRLMEVALFAFAISIALDVYVAMERIVGLSWAFAIGTAAFMLALLSWYVLALGFPGAKVKQERAMTEERPATPLAKKIDYMLTEARVVLPGVQALLGFQLIAVFTKRFEALPEELKAAHAVGLAMMTVSMVLLLAPAAFHRLGFSGEAAPTVHKVGSALVTWALAALALGLAAEVVVAIGALNGRLDVGALSGAVMLLILVGLWYAWPLASRAGLLTSSKQAAAKLTRRLAAHK